MMYLENSILSPELSSDHLSRSFNHSLIRFDLPSLIENMKLEQTWKKGELKSMILLKSPSKNILLTLIHKGTEIGSFQSDDTITFQLIEGEIKLHLRKESFTLYSGQLLTLNEKSKYKIDALDDSAFLMILESGN